MNTPRELAEPKYSDAECEAQCVRLKQLEQMGESFRVTHSEFRHLHDMLRSLLASRPSTPDKVGVSDAVFTGLHIDGTPRYERVAQQSRTKVSGVDPDALYEQLTSFADPSCRDCDGRGVFYGNVCVCGCVMSKLQSQSAEAVRDGERWRQAIFTVCEGFTLPADVRKILETAMWSKVDPTREQSHD